MFFGSRYGRARATATFAATEMRSANTTWLSVSGATTTTTAFKSSRRAHSATSYQ